MKKLFVISAPSGAGKTTLCQRLLKDFPNLSLSVSSTTRSPRRGEKNGVDYFFISKEKFQNQIDENQFAEWAIVHGNYYGTSKEFVTQTIASGKKILLDIDVQGAQSLRQAYPDLCLTLFIAPPDLKALEKRLRGRGTDPEAVIRERLQNAEEELKAAAQFDAIILNDDLEKAYLKLKTLIEEQI